MWLITLKHLPPNLFTTAGKEEITRMIWLKLSFWVAINFSKVSGEITDFVGI